MCFATENKYILTEWWSLYSSLRKFFMLEKLTSCLSTHVFIFTHVATVCCWACDLITFPRSSQVEGGWDSNKVCFCSLLTHPTHPVLYFVFLSLSLRRCVHRASWHSPLEEKDEVRCMLCFVFEYTLFWRYLEWIIFEIILWKYRNHNDCTWCVSQQRIRSRLDSPP